LLPSRPDDPAQKITFADDKWLMAPGGGASVEASETAIYLGMSLRNVGSGIAVLHGWRLRAELLFEDSPPPLEGFHRLTRDLYVPASDVGFWQGALRDPDTAEFADAAAAIAARSPLTVDVLYGDHEGGQRVISRFALRARNDGTWLPAAGRHWNLDRPAPR
jgi:hypothetical protein